MKMNNVALEYNQVNVRNKDKEKQMKVYYVRT